MRRCLSPIDIAPTFSFLPKQLTSHCEEMYAVPT